MGAYVEWREKFIGSAMAFEYREGRTVLTARPDMDNGRWYWSVHWPRHTAPPKKDEDGSQWIGGGVLPATTKWGIEDTAEQAKAKALTAFFRGRTGA